MALPYNGTDLFSTSSHDSPTTVPSDTTPQQAVAPLPESEECQTFAGEPLQYRPVVFYFLSGLAANPLHSVVMCTPSVAVSAVSVAVDLSSNATAVLAAAD